MPIFRSPFFFCQKWAPAQFFPPLYASPTSPFNKTTENLGLFKGQSKFKFEIGEERRAGRTSQKYKTNTSWKGEWKVVNKGQQSRFEQRWVSTSLSPGAEMMQSGRLCARITVVCWIFMKQTEASLGVKGKDGCTKDIGKDRLSPLMDNDNPGIRLKPRQLLQWC